MNTQPVVDMTNWQAQRDALLVREKAHSARATPSRRPADDCRWLRSTVRQRSSERTARFLDLFQGRDELVVYPHMWWDGAPHQGTCEGCTVSAWALKDAVHLNARGVSLAIPSVVLGPRSPGADHRAAEGGSHQPGGGTRRGARAATARRWLRVRSSGRRGESAGSW
jgi:predicted dithiol-disulfide oxidoreductase (DUF899 family)